MKIKYFNIPTASLMALTFSMSTSMATEMAKTIEQEEIYPSVQMNPLFEDESPNEIIQQLSTFLENAISKGRISYKKDENLSSVEFIKEIRRMSESLAEEQKEIIGDIVYNWLYYDLKEGDAQSKSTKFTQFMDAVFAPDTIMKMVNEAIKKRDIWYRDNNNFAPHEIVDQLKNLTKYLTSSEITELKETVLGKLDALYLEAGGGLDGWKDDQRDQFILTVFGDSQSDKNYENNYKKFIWETMNAHTFMELDEYYPEDVSPKEFLEAKTTLTSNEIDNVQRSVPSGPYGALGFYGAPWDANMFGDRIEEYNPSGKGWKIHITAQPHSAQKIANLILPHINDFNDKFDVSTSAGNKVGFKIIPTIPLLKTTWYLAPHIQGKETQAGKFIVIYPKNNEHAYELTKRFNELLLNAIYKGELDPQKDFLPLIGDAKVGNSGGVYVRYGHFTESRANDNRFYPWPDDMNKNNPDWAQASSPFHEQSLEWTPKCALKMENGVLTRVSSQKEPIIWNQDQDNRPTSWNDLDK